MSDTTLAANTATTTPAATGGTHRHGGLGHGGGKDFAAALAVSTASGGSATATSASAPGPIASSLGGELGAMLAQLQNGVSSSAADAFDNGNRAGAPSGDIGGTGTASGSVSAGAASTNGVNDAGSLTGPPPGGLMQRFADTARAVGGLALASTGPGGLAASVLL